MKAGLLLCVALSLAACAESRYRANLKHAALTPWTHLSRSDYEQVVRLVSDSARQPIIAITTDRSKRDMTRLHVISGYHNTAWTGTYVEKRAGGWQITSQGEISRFLARMRISGSI